MGKKTLIFLGHGVGVRVGVRVSGNEGTTDVGVKVGGATPNFWMQWLKISAT